MEIHDNIKNLREENHLTQEDMADKLHMSTSGYAKLERGETKLFHEKLEKIADIFGVSVYQLIPRKNDVNISVGDNNYNTFCYGNNSDDVDKLQLLLKHSYEIVKQKDNEIKALKEIIELLKQNKPF